MKFTWIFKGISAVGVITNKLPQILADGQVTVDELVDLVKSLLAIFDIPVAFNIPEEMAGQIIGATLEE